MPNYLLVDADGNLVNYIVWDGDENIWTLPDGLQAKQGDHVFREDWKWDGLKTYNTKPEPAAEPQPAPEGLEPIA
jgi:hypothetical protein